MQQPQILKFGGTSVADVPAFQRVVSILSDRSDNPTVVVVSAVAGVTDALFAVANGDPSADLDGALARYAEIAEALLTPRRKPTWQGFAESVRAEIEGMLEHPADGSGLERARRVDAIVGYGELLSAVLLAEVLESHGIAARPHDARSIVVTASVAGGARPDRAATATRARSTLAPTLREDRVAVVGGFVAADREGVTTTLGRGGSDFTASLLGAALDAVEIQIWTDVPGVLTADPRVVAEAQTVPELAWDEAAELAYFGARVLHPETIRPARERSVPIAIRSTLEPEHPGTRVGEVVDAAPSAVTAIAHRTGVTVVQVTSGRMMGAQGFLRALFEVFDRHATVVDVVATSEVSVSLTIEDDRRLDAIVADLGELGRVAVEHGRAIVCVVGRALRTTPGIATRVFRAVPEVGLDLISLGASQVNLTFVVGASEVEDVVRRLHAELVGSTARSGASPGVDLVSPLVQGDVEALTKALIDVPSVSGDEQGVAERLGVALRAVGYHVELEDAAPGRPNLFARGANVPSLVFCTHLDTVPPFYPAREDERWIHGRGACDAKGILAAQVLAAERLRRDGHDVGFLYVADEELGSIGARAAANHPWAGTCRHLIVGEPTDNRLVIGSRGSLQVRLHATGGGGHAGFGDPANSAIHRLLDALDAVRRIEIPSDPLLGEGTRNIGTIEGGVRPNVIATEAVAQVQFRLVGPSTDVLRAIEEVVGEHVRVEVLSATEAVRMRALPGFETCVVGFTSDVPHLGAWGESHLIGPGSIADAHTDHERIEKSELHRAVDLYYELASALLRDAARATTAKEVAS